VRKVEEMVSIEYEEYSEEVGSGSRMPGTEIAPIWHAIQSLRLKIRSHTHAHSRQTVQTQAHTHAVLAHTSHTHTVQYIHAYSTDSLIKK
jgi:hypothetical protein